MASNTTRTKRIRSAKNKPNKTNLKVDMKRITKNLEVLKKSSQS